MTIRFFLNNFFFFRVTVPGYQGNLSVIVGHTANIAPWERFGIEFMLSFIVVFSYFVSMDTYRKWTGTSSLTIGATYSACSFVSVSKNKYFYEFMSFL